MQIGLITVEGMQVATITWTTEADSPIDPFVPDLNGYVPQGRAASPPQGMSPPSNHQRLEHQHHHGTGATIGNTEQHHAPAPSQMGPEGPAHAPQPPHHAAPSGAEPIPPGQTYAPENLGRPVA